MDGTGMIDLYCERTAAGLLAEPLNAVTNIFFLVAAAMALRLARREGMRGMSGFLLPALLLAIGVGSALFHTFATPLASLADTVPILLFQLAFLALYARGVIGLERVAAVLFLGAYMLTILFFAQLPQDWLNGSIGYLPALFFVAGLGFWHRFHVARGRWLLMGAAGIFAVSLTLRSLDMALCAIIPAGVHFIWHTLNALVLYMTVAAYVCGMRPQGRGTAPL